MQVAVVGHVEWVQFIRVSRPPTPGAIMHAENSVVEPAGGAGVAAVELARLNGESTLYTAVGNDKSGLAIAPALLPYGVTVVAATRERPHRQAVTLVDPDGERTIVVIGPAQAPTAADGLADQDEFAELDAVYFCKGSPEVLRAARLARVVVATARELETVRQANVELDALVLSKRDPDEAYAWGDLPLQPRFVVATDGERGGSWQSSSSAGQWAATALPGPVQDSYGAGDCFAAALTFALAKGLDISEAVDLAATRGAFALCRSGAHGSATAGRT